MSEYVFVSVLNCLPYRTTNDDDDDNNTDEPSTTLDAPTTTIYSIHHTRTEYSPGREGRVRKCNIIIIMYVVVVFVRYVFVGVCPERGAFCNTCAGRRQACFNVPLALCNV